MKLWCAALALSLLAAGSFAAEAPLYFVPLAEPCRLVDTREPGTYFQPPLVAGEVRALMGVEGLCGVPLEAKALEANITATNTLGAGYLALMRPAGRIPANPQPKTSVLNFTGPGQTVANAAFVHMGETGSHHWDGSFWIVAGGSGTDLVIDIAGYYIAQ